MRFRLDGEAHEVRRRLKHVRRKLKIGLQEIKQSNFVFKEIYHFKGRIIDSSV